MAGVVIYRCCYGVFLCRVAGFCSLGMLYYNPSNRNGFGIGMLLGIGIDAHPLNCAAAIARMIISTLILGQFFKFEVSPLNLYDFAFYKGFRKAFPAASQDPRKCLLTDLHKGRGIPLV